MMLKNIILIAILIPVTATLAILSYVYLQDGSGSEESKTALSRTNDKQSLAETVKAEENTPEENQFAQKAKPDNANGIPESQPVEPVMQDSVSPPPQPASEQKPVSEEPENESESEVSIQQVEEEAPQLEPDYNIESSFADSIQRFSCSETAGTTNCYETSVSSGGSTSWECSELLGTINCREKYAFGGSTSWECSELLGTINCREKYAFGGSTSWECSELLGTINCREKYAFGGSTSWECSELLDVTRCREKYSLDSNNVWEFNFSYEATLESSGFYWPALTQ